MKKVTLLGLMATMLVFSACKGDSKKEEAGNTTASAETPAGGEAQKPAGVNQPKEYKVTITPDSALLGKKKEALVKIAGATAMVLQDREGKDNGIELTFRLTVTNKSLIGKGSTVYISYSDSRLQLDNGTNISHTNSSTGSLRAKPEATSEEESWTYKIPAGAKPTALNLFYKETRVSVGVALSE